MAKHIATYPLFGTNPLTGQIWNKRVGTGYISKPEQVEIERARLAKYGHPLRIRWRNAECEAEYYDWLTKKGPET